MTPLSNWNGASFTTPGAAKTAIWDRGTPGTLSLLIVTVEQEKNKNNFGYLIPQVFPVSFRETILELEGRKNTYSEYGQLPTSGIWGLSEYMPCFT